MTATSAELSFRQTQQLLNLVDATLKEICCRTFTDEELYVDAIQRVLGRDAGRSPENVFIVFKQPGEDVIKGRVFTLNSAGFVEQSEMIVVAQVATYAINLSTDDVIRSNWCDNCESIGLYQKKFHPIVKRFVGRPITNFINKRISGEPPGAIIAFNYPNEATEYDAAVLNSLSVVIGSLVTLSTKIRETERAFIYTIEALARSCEAADEDTGNHIVRVNRYAEALAMALGLPQPFVGTIAYSAQMHDVGKVHVPVSIIRKAGPLDEQEMAIMKQHTTFGARIIGGAPRLAMARDVAHSHHENWDGSGYPGNLKGEEIPLSARIVKVADIYDALRSKRSYKPALSHAEVLAVFRNGDVRVRPAEHFDPKVLQAFFRIEQTFAEIFRELA